jgi:hypothetical protein
MRFKRWRKFWVVVTAGDQHRANAANCLRLAQDAPDDANRALYLMMAEAWRALAEREDARAVEKRK